jgi:hypothetical protein
MDHTENTNPKILLLLQTSATAYQRPLFTAMAGGVVACLAVIV